MSYALDANNNTNDNTVHPSIENATLLILSLHRYYDPLTRKSWSNTVAA
jgi:hypothetical protein